jgi:hypothetical protein
VQRRYALAKNGAPQEEDSLHAAVKDTPSPAERMPTEAPAARRRDKEGDDVKDNKMLAAVLIIIIVLALGFIVWRVTAGKRAPAGDQGGGAAPVELKPGTIPTPPPAPGKAAPAGGG